MINFHLERQSVSLAPWGVKLQPVCKHVNSPQAKLINPAADLDEDTAESLLRKSLGMERSQLTLNTTSISVHLLTIGSLRIWGGKNYIFRPLLEKHYTHWYHLGLYPTLCSYNASEIKAPDSAELPLPLVLCLNEFFVCVREYLWGCLLIGDVRNVYCVLWDCFEVVFTFIVRSLFFHTFCCGKNAKGLMGSWEPGLTLTAHHNRRT